MSEHNATQQAAEQAQATGLLDQAFGPFLEFWNGLPIYGKVGVAGAAGAGFLIFHWINNRETESKLNATDWREKWENLLKSPTEKIGAPENTLLMNQSNSATKRTIGVIKKLQETSTDIAGDELENSLDDEDLWDNLKNSGDLNVDSVTYSVVTGRKKLDRIIGNIIYKIAGVFSSGSNPKAEYFDLPLDKIEVTDQGVVIKEDVHIFKKDGLWQTASNQGQHRLMQLSALTTHQNWLESLQKHPEFYSDLNMKVSGQKNIMNQKSENMRQYKKEEKMQEKGEAMQE